MMFKALSVAALATALASPALANPFFQTHIQTGPLTKNASSQVRQGNYTDFSGVWEGQCSNAMSNQLETLRITNDQFRMTINNDQFPINGISSKFNSMHNVTEGDHFSIRWNDDKSALILNDINYGQLHNTQKAGSLETTLVNGKITLDSDKLKVQVAAQRYEDAQAMESYDIVCTYTKK